MGVNRWSDIEERKRNETDAKAGDQIPKEEKGDAGSRLEASEGPAENPESARSSRYSRSGKASTDPGLEPAVPVGTLALRPIAARRPWLLRTFLSPTVRRPTLEESQGSAAAVLTYSGAPASYRAQC
jgi:hypothetical protein